MAHYLEVEAANRLLWIAAALSVAAKIAVLIGLPFEDPCVYP
jgi:hypothetical protein